MKYFTGIFLFLFLIVACKEEADPRFSVTSDQVGLITKSTTINELETVLATDSIVKPKEMPAGQQSSEIIEVFERGGKHLLSITPSTDSLPGIANIRVRDIRYATPEGINTGSTFKDIRDKLNVRKVVTSLNNVVILIKDSDLYFTISKEELPAELRFANTDIDMIQIPDKARIKYMMIGWN